MYVKITQVIVQSKHGHNKYLAIQGQNIIKVTEYGHGEHLVCAQWNGEKHRCSKLIKILTITYEPLHHQHYEQIV